MTKIEYLHNKLKTLLDDSKQEKILLRENVNKQLIKMNCTQEEVDSNWTKTLVIQRLKESTSDKEIKILLNEYIKLCQEKKKITTLTKIIKYIETQLL